MLYRIYEKNVKKEQKQDWARKFSLGLNLLFWLLWQGDSVSVICSEPLILRYHEEISFKIRVYLTFSLVDLLSFPLERSFASLIELNSDTGSCSPDGISGFTAHPAAFLQGVLSGAFLQTDLLNIGWEFCLKARRTKKGNTVKLLTCFPHTASLYKETLFSPVLLLCEGDIYTLSLRFQFSNRISLSR